MVDIVPVDQVLHDSTGLEELDGCTIGHGIGQGRYASVGVDFHEPFTFVVHVGKTDMLDIVRHTKLFKDGGDFVAIRRLCGVQADSRFAGHAGQLFSLWWSSSLLLSSEE